VNIEGESAVILDEKKVLEIDLGTGEKRVIKKLKEGLKMKYTHFSSMPWGSYRIGNIVYFGVGLKINIFTGDSEFVEPFGMIANDWGKYKAIISRKDGRIEGITGNGESVLFGDGIQINVPYDVFGERLYGVYLSLFLLLDLTPNSLYGITKSGRLLKVDLNTLDYYVFPLGLTEPSYYVDMDVSSKEKYIGLTTYEEEGNYHIYILDKNLSVIEEKKLNLSSTSKYIKMLFSNDEENLFVFLYFSDEPITGIKYHLEDNLEEVFDLSEVKQWWPPTYSVYKYYVYPEKIFLMNIFSCGGCCALPMWACLIIKESQSKLSLIDSECEDGSFQHIFRDKKTGEIKSWIVLPRSEKLRLVNLSTQKIEFEMPIEWEW
jgi:hypothetical protein